VRRARWLESGGFDEGLALTADWEFWQRLVLGGSGIGLVAEPLARYRLSSGTLSSDRSRLIRARLEVLARAGARRDLSPGERRVVARARRRERRNLRLRLADAGLDRGGWPARARAAAVVLTPGVEVRARLGAARAVFSPARAARRRTQRRGATVQIGAGLRVPARPVDDQPSG
jgi:hypothetical protein